MHGRRYTESLVEGSHQVPWQPSMFFPHVVFHPKLMGILALLGMWSSGWGEDGLLHLRPSCLNPPNCLSPPHVTIV